MLKPKGACPRCLSPGFGWRRLTGSFFLPQLGLQGCPGPASEASLGRAPLGVGRCPMAELPHWQWALGLYASRDCPSRCPVSRQEAISQPGNCPLTSPELLFYMPNVVGWSVLVPRSSVIAFLLPRADHRCETTFSAIPARGHEDCSLLEPAVPLPLPRDSCPR